MTLRKHYCSNLLKISPPKTQSFQITRNVSTELGCPSVGYLTIKLQNSTWYKCLSLTGSGTYVHTFVQTDVHSYARTHVCTYGKPIKYMHPASSDAGHKILIFFIFWSSHRLRVPDRTASTRQFQRVPTIYVFEQK